MKQPYNTALYYRLSRDDENFGDSVSIETQRTILQQFARDNQFHVVEEYIDDGWSGTNFDRPAFQRMMDDSSLVAQSVKNSPAVRKTARDAGDLD